MKEYKNVFPEVLASTRSRNAKLIKKEEQLIDALAEKIELGEVTFEKCIEIIAPIKKRFDREGVDKTGTPKSSLALPVTLIQIILYINYKYNDATQNKIIERFKEQGTSLNKKIFELESTVRDYRNLVNYKQPAMHIKYKGQKTDKYKTKEGLATAIKHLTYQAGKHSYFVDIFGGSGAATLAVPRKNNTEYVYNDLDKGMACLYNVLADKELCKELIGYIEILCENLRGESTVLDTEFDSNFKNEIFKFYEGRRYGETAANILEYNSYDEIQLKWREQNLYEYIKYYYECLNKINTKEAEVLKRKFELYDNGVLNVSKVITDWCSGVIKNAEFVEFAQNNNIELMKYYGHIEEFTFGFGDDIKKLNVVSNPINNYDKFSEQYRYFKWYANFSNHIYKINEEKNNDCIELVYTALAQMYISSFLFNNNKSPDKIYKILDKKVNTGNGHLKFVEDLPITIKRIRDITGIIADGKTIVKSKEFFEIIKSYSKKDDGNKTDKTLFYSDSPYISTSGYDVRKWSGNDSKTLIDALVNSDQKFIFSCRACATTKRKNRAAEINLNIFYSVLNYFDLKCKNRAKGKNKLKLWVTYISEHKMPMECVIARNKQAEIMITNYEIQPFGSDGVVRVMTYKEFMRIIKKYLYLTVL